MAAIGIQRELRHHEHLARNIRERAIRLPRIVGHDAQIANLCPELLRYLARISIAHTQQDEISLADAADGPFFDDNRSARHALNDGPHASSPAIWADRSCSAWKRWLMAFFSAGVSSAMVLPGVSAGRNSGS